MTENEVIEFVSDRKKRQENMTELLNALNPDETEFNTMILGFADIIQSSFYPYLVSQCKNEKERDVMDERINDTVSSVMTTLNAKSLSNPEDMVILSTIMIEAITKALVRQNDSGLRVSQKLQNIRKSPR